MGYALPAQGPRHFGKVRKVSDCLNSLNILYHTKVSAFHQRISCRSSILPLTMLNLVCYIFFNISVHSCSLPPALFARLCLGFSDTFETLPQPLLAPTPSPAAPVYNVQL